MKQIFKIVRTETTSQTAFILAENENAALNAVTEDGICWRENHDYDCDFSQPIPATKTQVKGRYIDVINEDGEIEGIKFEELKNKIGTAQTP